MENAFQQQWQLAGMAGSPPNHTCPSLEVFDKYLSRAGSWIVTKWRILCFVLLFFVLYCNLITTRIHMGYSKYLEILQ